MGFSEKLAAGMAKLADTMFGEATLVTVVQDYDPRLDKTVEATTGRTVQAIRASESITDNAGVTKTETVAYLLVEPAVNDRLSMGQTTNVVRSVDRINPAGLDIMFRAVLS